MRCPKCNWKVDKNVNFCPKCGARVSWAKKRKGNRSKKTVLIVLLLVAIIVVGWMLGTTLAKHISTEKNTLPESQSGEYDNNQTDLFPNQLSRETTPDVESNKSEENHSQVTFNQPTSSIIDSGFCGDNLTWTFDNEGTLTISGTGAMWDYVISDDYPEHPPWDTYRKNQIQSVVIEKGVTSLGAYAFYFCKSLVNVSIPNSVTSLGFDCFSACSNLTYISIPDSVITIGDWCFNSCENLTRVIIPDSVTTIGDWSFSHCKSLNDITVPEGVTNLGSKCFAYCDSLTSITFTGNAPAFGKDAFYSTNATAHYPSDDATWTDVINRNYGGTITWVPTSF